MSPEDFQFLFTEGLRLRDTPSYDTTLVTLTNKFESGSQPLRINVSPTTHELLKDSEGFQFQPRERKYLPKEFPPDIPGTCHFLLGYTHPGLDPSASSSEHILMGSRSQGLGKEKPEFRYNVAEL